MIPDVKSKLVYKNKVSPPRTRGIFPNLNYWLQINNNSCFTHLNFLHNNFFYGIINLSMQYYC